MRIPRVVIAGTHSGVGKTTLTTGLLAALRRRGLRVQSFKAGPDYIDPACHHWATGRPGRNLDTWLMPAAAVRELFERATTGARAADVTVIEGVMGLFDGALGGDEAGSTALLAKWLQAPVVLVVDARASARSLAATVLGFQRFDPGLMLAGVIANRVGSERHAEMVRDALAGLGLPLLGAVGRNDALILPESRLGLVVPHRHSEVQPWLDDATAAVERAVDVEALWRVAQGAPPMAAPPMASPPMAPPPTAGPATAIASATAPVCFPAETAGRFAGLRIGVAADAALWFYYPESLEVLAHLGAEVVPFSLTDDEGLPLDLDGLYLGGGFPERHAPALAANAAMRDAVARAWQSGMPVLAECGGYLYLHQALSDEAGNLHPMAGCLAGTVRLMPRLQGMGYRLAVPPGAPPPDPAVPPGLPAPPDPAALADVAAQAAPVEPIAVRGHVFHYSRCEGGQGPPAWDLYRADGSFERADGWAGPGQAASFLHVHLPTQPRLTQRFLSACRAYGQRRQEGRNGVRTRAEGR